MDVAATVHAASTSPMGGIAIRNSGVKTKCGYSRSDYRICQLLIVYYGCTATAMPIRPTRHTLWLILALSVAALTEKRDQMTGLEATQVSKGMSPRQTVGSLLTPCQRETRLCLFLRKKRRTMGDGPSCQEQFIYDGQSPDMTRNGISPYHTFDTHPHPVDSRSLPDNPPLSPSISRRENYQYSFGAEQSHIVTKYPPDR